MKFYITEVFSERPYGGNQLATVLDAAQLPTDEMQRIARAFNFSETTFFVGGDEASGFDVRIFTPDAELPFAGHPTLGSAFLARHLYTRDEAEVIRLNLGVGQIPVTFSADGVAWMRQKSPVFGSVVGREVVAPTLGLAPEELSAGFPCQYVSTGLEFLIVPVNTLAALKRITIQSRDFGHGLFAFCPQGYEGDQAIAARMFAESFGVSEDPATGSANGCLASYLVEHGFFSAGEAGDHAIDLRVGQGYEIDRPSQLYLRANKTAGVFEINVGGKVNLVADGEWRL